MEGQEPWFTPPLDDHLWDSANRHNTKTPYQTAADQIAGMVVSQYANMGGEYYRIVFWTSPDEPSCIVPFTGFLHHRRSSWTFSKLLIDMRAEEVVTMIGAVGEAASFVVHEVPHDICARAVCDTDYVRILVQQ